MKTIFLGTPAIAVPFLELLHKKTEVAAVITNPDQPAGRGYEVKAPPVKEAALTLSLPVFQPTSLRSPSPYPLPEEREFMKVTSPGGEVGHSPGEGGIDLGIVVAYGKLLPPDFLKLPKHGFLNVHFSLLPKYRGAAPMQWALINGEAETGVTLFWLDEGMDTGPIFLQKRIAVESDDADSLRRKLVGLGVEALAEAIDRVSSGRIERQPQQGVPSKAPMLTKEDGLIQWTHSARSLVDLIRGTHPWPGAFTWVKAGAQAQRLKIVRAEVVAGEKAAEAGTIVRIESGQGFDVRCGVDSLKILEVQPEGKKPMPAWSFWQGARLEIGRKLG